MKEPNISIYFFFLPVIQWCSISDVLFTGGREVSDFSVLKILSECLRILIDCSQLSKTIITCSVVPPEIVVLDAYICGRSENNIKCVLYDDLGQKN